MKPVKGGQGPVWAVAPLIIIIITNDIKIRSTGTINNMNTKGMYMAIGVKDTMKNCIQF
jgi:hypothetical protein